VAEVARTERVVRGLMGLIRLWKGVEESKRARLARPTLKGSQPGIAADEAADC